MPDINITLIASILFVAGISGRVFVFWSHLNTKKLSSTNISCILGLTCAEVGSVITAYFANIHDTNYAGYYLLIGAVVYVIGEALILVYVNPILEENSE